MRALRRFWAGVLMLAFLGVVTLEVLGPPHHRQAQGPVPAKLASAKPASSLASLHPAATEPNGPGRLTGGPVAAADPTLLEAIPGAADGISAGGLPRIGADGRMPMQVYARGFDATDRRPHIGLLLGGVGMNEAASADAIRTLPGEVSLAISPYAIRPEPTLQLARTFGHEFLLAIPMEPEGYPLNDAGNQSLLTRSTPAENQARMTWALSRIAGYVGATSALNGLRGERFAVSADQMGAVQDELAARGLLYVDARPPGADPGLDTPPRTWHRRVDLVVDEPPLRADIEAKLARLEDMARAHRTALGLVGVIRPVTMEVVLAWSNGLTARGLSLAPVSALMRPPAVKTTAAALTGEAAGLAYGRAMTSAQ